MDDVVLDEVFVVRDKTNNNVRWKKKERETNQETMKCLM